MACLPQRLYLLQYPLRPVKSPYGAATGKDPAIRIKPKQDMVEMQYQINTASETYDDSRGRELAEATVVEGKVDQSNTMFPSGQMDVHTLKSSKVPMRTHYVAGAWKNNALHLTPLKVRLAIQEWLHALVVRDQSALLSPTRRSLIFTRLLSLNTLLPAVLCRNGADTAIGFKNHRQCCSSSLASTI